MGTKHNVGRRGPAPTHCKSEWLKRDERLIEEAWLRSEGADEALIPRLLRTQDVMV